MRRYSNLDTVQKTLRMLQSAGLISPNQRLKPATMAEIVAKYEAGEPSTAIAVSYGLSKGSVIRLLREAGVSIRNQGLTDDHITEAAQLYESGLSLAKIGARFGVDHGTVWRALKKRDVTMRDTHGRTR
jgi:transposase-like protein